MSEKSYLKNQIKLVSLDTNDMFTDDEHDKYMEVVELSNEIGRLRKERTPENIVKKKEVIEQKKHSISELNELIKQHKGVIRRVRLKSVLHLEKDEEVPLGVTWEKLKISNTITEFESDLSRTMGIVTNDYTLDKIIVSWGPHKEDMLSQLVLDGFIMEVIEYERIIQKKYRFFTAGAAQLRRDKVVFLSEDIWNTIKNTIECGLTWEKINERGGMNVNKLLAYWALCCSATDPWENFNIDRCIVVPDWQSEVTGMMMFIKPDYTTEIGIRTVMINHIDGCGMIDPSSDIIPPGLEGKNFMFRGGTAFKGLLSSFPFLRWCEEHHIEPVIKDFWGKEWNLKRDRISVVFSESQFKLCKLYKSWDEYKTEYKKNNCHFGTTQYEEDYIPDKNYNYQMTQTLVDMTDDEIKKLTSDAHQKLKTMTKDKNAMLDTIGAGQIYENLAEIERLNKEIDNIKSLNNGESITLKLKKIANLEEKIMSNSSDKIAIALYPELLRDGYNRKQLKDIKRRMIYDAKSSAFKLKNKRLFAIPDLYAACEYWFLGDKHPKGLLADGEIACRIYRWNYDEADVLRSPHLYMEHALRKIVKDPEIYRWFNTDGVYTSCHDLISRILQFDVDGDQLNVVVDETIISVAKRNIEEHNIIPLFYDANKAPNEMVTQENLLKGLMRAHKYSNIGEISDMLTRLWNRDNPDYLAAALLTYLNNLRIDGAKTGAVNEYTNYPDVAKRINKATGGPHGRLPFFFQFSKNGRTDKTNGKRKRKWAENNSSTMNRICASFNDIGNINMKYANIFPFNWEMLMSEPCKGTRSEIIEDFVALSELKRSFIINNAEDVHDEENLSKNYIIEERLRDMLISKYGSLERCYPYVCKFLFAGENLSKAAHKQTFWRIFGNIAVNNLKNNLSNYQICPKCKAKYPAWIEESGMRHSCQDKQQGLQHCVDCGELYEKINSKQNRCAMCQEIFRADQKKAYRERKKAAKEAHKAWVTSLLQSSSRQT